MKDKLKVKVWNYKNVVLYEVLEQDENLRNLDLRFKASNGWEIYSCNNPSIFPDNKMFIRGLFREYDKDIDIVETETVEEARQLVKDIRQAVKEFNESQNQVLTNKEKEYLSGVIKPFRNKVIYIEKREYTDGEFIRIVNKGDDNVSFPNFEKGTMYKEMKLYRKYTLEELGL